MKKTTFRNYVNKFIKRETSEQEEWVLDEFIRQHQAKQTQEDLFNSAEEKKQIKAQLWTVLEKSSRSKVIPFHARMRWQVAASLVLFIGLGALLAYFGGNDSAMLMASTAASEQKEIILPDGSTVWLNNQSSIRYAENFDGDRRAIELKGEAFFEVTKNPKKPFEVTTDQFTVTVLGTSFNVSTYLNERATVSVASGKVKVANETQSIQLLPNEMVSFTAQNHLKKSTAALENQLAWRNQEILLHQADVFDLELILERWYGIEIKLAEELEGKSCEWSGKFKYDSLENILQSLSFIHALEYKKINEQTIEIIEIEC